MLMYVFGDLLLGFFVLREKREERRERERERENEKMRNKK